jgi:hypothetical protein
MSQPTSIQILDTAIWKELAAEEVARVVPSPTWLRAPIQEFSATHRLRYAQHLSDGLYDPKTWS